MERDQRITGAFRAQSSNHQAPPGFDVSNPWKVRTEQAPIIYAKTLTRTTDREADLLDSKLQPHFPITLYACAFLFFRDYTYPLQLSRNAVPYPIYNWISQ
jgi:hypothetical protein